MRIPFNKPALVGREITYMRQAVESGKISGDGEFTRRVHAFFEERFGFERCLLTTSCTDALEMAAILLDIQPGDEVIVPSFTFVSTANAFVLRGAKIVFADSRRDHPNLDAAALGELITPRTKAIVPVHYAGVACDMDAIMEEASARGIFVVEDAAQAITSTYKDRPLGGIGHLATFSFHETKNVISGEGGMLVINDGRFAARAEIIREKGTNRSAFFRGEVDKYGWVDVGSSFLPSDIIAAYLYAQLEELDEIQRRRAAVWNTYNRLLSPWAQRGWFEVPSVPDFATNNAHMFYLVCRSLEERTAVIDHLRARGIFAVFHYQSLHRSTFYQDRHDHRPLPNADRYTDCLVRLPLYFELRQEQVEEIARTVIEAFESVVTRR